MGEGSLRFRSKRSIYIERERERRDSRSGQCALDVTLNTSLRGGKGEKMRERERKREDKDEKLGKSRQKKSRFNERWVEEKKEGEEEGRKKKKK